MISIFRNAFRFYVRIFLYFIMYFSENEPRFLFCGICEPNLLKLIELSFSRGFKFVMHVFNNSLHLTYYDNEFCRNSSSNLMKDILILVFILKFFFMVLHY